MSNRITVKIASDTSELVKLQTEARRFSARFRAAFQGASGAGAFAALIAGVHELKTGFEAMVRQGIQFNAQMQDSQIGVAAVLRQFNPQQFQTFGKAMTASGDAIDLLKEKAKRSPATFQQLVGAFQGLSGAASSAGLSMKQQVDLVVLMSQTLAGLGIRSEQILQESRALMTGNINEDAAAARILGITKSMVDKARAEGKLYDFLVGKMSGFSEAAEVGAESYTTALSNMEDATTQLYGELSQPIFEILRQSLLEMNKTLNSTQFKAALRPFFQDAETLVRLFVSLANWTARNGEEVGGLVRALGKLAAAYGAMRITDWIVTIGREMSARRAGTSAVAAETAAINANTLAKTRNFAASAGGIGRAPGLPAPRGIVPYGTGLGPMGRGGPTIIDVPMEITKIQRASSFSLNGIFSRLRSFPGIRVLFDPAKAGRMIGQNVIPALGAALAGWEIGKALRRPIFGHNGAEDLDRAGDLQEQWNVRAKALDEQRRGVTSVADKTKYINDLLDARAEIEDELAKESAPLLRAELEQQLRIIDMMADGAQRIDDVMMAANKRRTESAAAISKANSAIEKNSAAFDEGRKAFGKTDREALQAKLAELTKGGDATALAEQYRGIAKNVDALKKMAPPSKFSLDQAERAVADAKRRLNTEIGKGETVRAQTPVMGSGIGPTFPVLTSSPNGDVAGARAALAAAEERAKKVRELRDLEIAGREAALKGTQAAGEETRKRREEILETIKAIDELNLAQRRTDDAVSIREAESRGDFGAAEAIKRRQAREDLERELRDQGRKPGDVDAILSRFDHATKADEARARNRTRGDLAVSEREAAGDHRGAEALRRQRALEDFRETLSRQGFSKPQQDEMVKRQAAIQGAEQTKALRRFNLETRGLEARAAGNKDEARAIERALKQAELSERLQREFGLDEKSATTLAKRRLAAEDAARPGRVVADSQARIGAGGHVAFIRPSNTEARTAKAAEALLKEARNQVTEIKALRDKLTSTWQP